MCMFGPPNAGKGTYGIRLARLAGVPYLSCGNLLRERMATDEAWFEGRYTKAMQDAGELCPSDLANRIIFEAIGEAPDGCVLDGFPREAGQVQPFLDMAAGRDFCVVEITHPASVLIARSANRRVCRGCGKSYAVGNPHMEPPEDMLCGECGGPIVHRDDDDPVVMAHRIEVYHRQTEPILQMLREQCLMHVRFSPSGGDVDAISETLWEKMEAWWSLDGLRLTDMSGEIEITMRGVR